MPKFEFLVETVYEEVVEVEAATLEDAEGFIAIGEGAQVDMVKALTTIINYREVD